MDPIVFSQLMMRAIRLKCPACAEQKLFKRYLKQIDCCAHCKTEWRHFRADDGPAWLTILLLGHILLPITVWFAMETNFASWKIILGLCTLATLLVLALLPVTKAIFLALLWRTGAGANRS